MAKVSSKKTEQTKPVYNPNKNYQWQPEDEFTLSGTEFSTLYNSLKEAALSPSGTSAANTVASYNILQGILVMGIEEGVIKEVLPPSEATLQDENPEPERPTKVRRGRTPKEESEGEEKEG